MSSGLPTNRQTTNPELDLRKPVSRSGATNQPTMPTIYNLQLPSRTQTIRAIQQANIAGKLQLYIRYPHTHTIRGYRPTYDADNRQSTTPQPHTDDQGHTTGQHSRQTTTLQHSLSYTNIQMAMPFQPTYNADNLQQCRSLIPTYRRPSDNY